MYMYTRAASIMDRLMVHCVHTETQLILRGFFFPLHDSYNLYHEILKVNQSNVLCPKLVNISVMCRGAASSWCKCRSCISMHQLHCRADAKHTNPQFGNCS